MGAGRTDTGVHAQQMVAHFDIDTPIDVKDSVYKLNVYLPKDIHINTIKEVHPEIHARFDALSRTYIYKISRTKEGASSATLASCSSASPSKDVGLGRIR